MATPKKATPATPATPAPVTCATCGKVITNPKSVSNTMGSLCARHAKNGFTPAKMLQHRQSMQGAIPAGYVKVAQVSAKIRATQANNKTAIAGLSVNRFVTALGRDRCKSGATHPIFTPIYAANGHRWVHPWVISKAGLQAIATGNIPANVPTK